MIGQRIGYIRVSTFDQNPERQLGGIEVDRSFTDKASGKDTKRPELEALMRFARTGEDSPMANLMLSVMSALAEFERALIHERQREGIAPAKQRGVYRGRKKSLSDLEIAGLRQRAAAGEQKATLAREFGISRETLYQYLRAPE